jgi:hypothetical protein
MEPTYEDMIKFMTDYFNAYNNYAQNPATVNKMSDYFTPEVLFIPYMSVFGGPKNAVTSRDRFFQMFTGHPANYEQFTVEDVVVDEKRMVATALLDVTLYESKTNKELVRKHYLVRYELVLDDRNTLKIKKILFFWEATSPEDDAAYTL